MHQHVFAQRSEQSNFYSANARRKNDRFQFTLSVCVNKACAHLRIIEFALDEGVASKLFKVENFPVSDRIDSVGRRIIQFGPSSLQKGYTYINIRRIVSCLFTSRRGQWVRTQAVHRVDPLSADCWMSEWAPSSGGHQSMSPRGAPASNNMRRESATPP